MARHQSQSSYTAGRTITLGGTTYAPGATIPAATVKALKKLSALLSNREIIPNVDPWKRKGKLKTPTPTDMSPVQRRALP